MNYWLLKSEPETWSWQNQIDRGAEGEPWNGVRNFQARTNLKLMAKGDLAFFYHSGAEKAVVGIVEVMTTAYPDPKDPVWVQVDVKAVKPVPKPVTLAAIKADPQFKDFLLVRHSRLSVVPVSAAHWRAICKMGGVSA